MRKIQSTAFNSIKKHNMVEKGDRILIGFSGGKDSFMLLETLLQFKKVYPVKFDFIALTVDIAENDFSNIKRYMEKIDVEYIIKKTRISEVVDEQIEDERPGRKCSLCARIRRALLHKAAQVQGCNKIALGHNLDDAIITFLLNFFYSGNPDLMKPISKSQNHTIIRPIIDVPEELIRAHSKDFPILNQKCQHKPEESRRVELKGILNKLSKGNPMIYSSASTALNKLWENKLISAPNDKELN